MPHDFVIQFDEPFGLSKSSCAIEPPMLSGGHPTSVLLEIVRLVDPAQTVRSQAVLYIVLNLP